MQACFWWKTFGYLPRCWSDTWCTGQIGSVLGQSPVRWLCAASLLSMFHLSIRFYFTLCLHSCDWGNSIVAVGSKLGLSGAEIVQITSTNAQQKINFFFFFPNVEQLDCFSHCIAFVSKNFQAKFISAMALDLDFTYLISSSARCCLLGNYKFFCSIDRSLFYLLKSVYI